MTSHIIDQRAAAAEREPSGFSSYIYIYILLLPAKVNYMNYRYDFLADSIPSNFLFSNFPRFTREKPTYTITQARPYCLTSDNFK